MEYPVTLERDDNDTLLVSFPDFPEAHTFGDDREEALARAQDALATIIDAYIKERRAIPSASGYRHTGGQGPLRCPLPAPNTRMRRLPHRVERELVGTSFESECPAGCPPAR